MKAEKHFTPKHKDTIDLSVIVPHKENHLTPYPSNLQP